ncbi:MAG: 3-dehydroquinate synthase [Prevotella sp.]|nr:3-dehydroquinate synthase [Prevotella sp.]
MEQRIIISGNLQEELAMTLSECEHDKIFVLTDEHTVSCCWPLIKDFLCLKDATVITIQASDTHKDIQALTYVWEQLSKQGATRHSCLINLGGGMVTDLGGFAASTFKRGINFINIPTTLLAMVDASVGGKTGINLNGLKNEVGVFNDSEYVILCTHFLKTLDYENIVSGYAEMLKHGLISFKKMWSDLLNFPLEVFSNPQQPIDEQFIHQLQLMVGASVKVKENVVEVDPFEQNMRKALNFGHTIGHALETFTLRKEHPILHGYAVAYGMICELYLSAIRCHFPQDILRQTVSFIREYYGTLDITCDDYPELLELMKHDKKNTAGTINFTLLGDIGDIQINQDCSEEEIKEALDFFREG